MEDHVVFAENVKYPGDMIVVPVAAIVTAHAQTPFRHADLTAADDGRGYTVLWDRLKREGKMA